MVGRAARYTGAGSHSRENRAAGRRKRRRCEACGRGRFRNEDRLRDRVSSVFHKVRPSKYRIANKMVTNEHRTRTSGARYGLRAICRSDHEKNHNNSLRRRGTPPNAGRHGGIFRGLLRRGQWRAAFTAQALGDIARAKGMAQVARDTGLSRESLYKALSGDRSPGFDTILKVIEAVGLRLCVQIPPGRDRPPVPRTLSRACGKAASRMRHPHIVLALHTLVATFLDSANCRGATADEERAGSTSP